MLISIVTPSFDQDRYIEETIRSVLSQDHPQIEYMIADAGSTDNTVSIIRKYEHRLACWVSEKDQGQTDVGMLYGDCNYINESGNVMRVHYRDSGSFFSALVARYYLRKFIAPVWIRRRHNMLNKESGVARLWNLS